MGSLIWVKDGSIDDAENDGSMDSGPDEYIG